MTAGPGRRPGVDEIGEDVAEGLTVENRLGKFSKVSALVHLLSRRRESTFEKVCHVEQRTPRLCVAVQRVVWHWARGGSRDCDVDRSRREQATAQVHQLREDAVDAIFERDIGAKPTVEGQLRLQKRARYGFDGQRGVDDLVIDQDVNVALHEVKVCDLPYNRYVPAHHLLPRLRRVQHDDRALNPIVRAWPFALPPCLSGGAARASGAPADNAAQRVCEQTGEAQ